MWLWIQISITVQSVSIRLNNKIFGGPILTDESHKSEVKNEKTKRKA